MKAEVFMPKFGMTMTEGTISKWLKTEGEYVSLDEPLAEIETEKIIRRSRSSIISVFIPSSLILKIFLKK